LNRVTLRDDAPGLALRGIAMAQLGDLVRTQALLRSAARFRSESGRGPRHFSDIALDCRFIERIDGCGAPLRPLRKSVAPSRAKAFATAPPMARWTRCRSTSS
jgi:hypothetical protein